MDIPLARTEVLDCQGRTTHTVTLEIDGTVTIHFHAGGHRARVDPATRTVLTPGVQVAPALLDHAAALRP